MHFISQLLVRARQKGHLEVAVCVTCVQLNDLCQQAAAVRRENCNRKHTSYTQKNIYMAQDLLLLAEGRSSVVRLLIELEPFPR
jgi:hypothetical protein